MSETIGQILTDAGLVTIEQIRSVLSSSNDGKKARIGELLISSGYITNEQLLMALAQKFELDFIDLSGSIRGDVDIEIGWHHESIQGIYGHRAHPKGMYVVR